MANIQLLAPLILKWEGGYTNNPADLGGATNKGVTLSVWKQQGYDKNDDGGIDVEDLKLLSAEDVVERILRPHYWNRWQADRIPAQALANILVDWVWCSGSYGIKIPQSVLALKSDGIVGEKTLRAVNDYPDPEGLFDKIKQVRRAYLNMICIDRPANKRFLKGWLNRLNDFKWIPMAMLFCILLSCGTTKKTEVKGERYKVKGEMQAEIQTKTNSIQTQNENRSTDQAEQRTTEIVTAEFDTLNLRPILKKLRIERTIADRAIHAEQQVESRAAGTEVKDEKSKVKGESETKVQTKVTKSPAWNSMVGWLAGGVVIVLLSLLFVARKKSKFFS